MTGVPDKWTLARVWGVAILFGLATLLVLCTAVPQTRLNRPLLSYTFTVPILSVQAPWALVAAAGWIALTGLFFFLQGDTFRSLRMATLMTSFWRLMGA